MSSSRYDSMILIAYLLVFCVDYVCPFSFGHCIVCPSLNDSY